MPRGEWGDRHTISHFFWGKFTPLEIADVHSGSADISLEGTAYSTW